ncbi:hypothetical protein AKJ16_DCAP20759, partial [Drosera capensis]
IVFRIVVLISRLWASRLSYILSAVIGGGYNYCIEVLCLLACKIIYILDANVLKRMGQVAQVPSRSINKRSHMSLMVDVVYLPSTPLFVSG